ncbi:MAG: universal stress protein [Candidatus Thorarchaeota archaeon]
MSEEVKPVDIETIVVAVDGSEHSDKAVQYACSIGPSMDAEVILLHVVPMLVSATPYQDTVSDQPFLALEKVGEDILTKAKTLASNLGCEVTDLLDHGDPASRIIEIADEKDADIIIMGSRGLSGIKRFFVGSISDKVTNHAKCPVMLVR